MRDLFNLAVDDKLLVSSEKDFHLHIFSLCTLFLFSSWADKYCYYAKVWLVILFIGLSMFHKEVLFLSLLFVQSHSPLPWYSNASWITQWIAFLVNFWYNSFKQFSCLFHSWVFFYSFSSFLEMIGPQKGPSFLYSLLFAVSRIYW